MKDTTNTTEGPAGISRRLFLTGLGASSALVAAGALAACAPAASVPPTDAGSGGGAAPEASTWRTPLAPPAEADIVETVDVDVVVVGAGSSGLGAGRSALLHGAQSVLVLEKAPASRIGGGVHGILGSKFAREIGVEFSNEVVNEMIKEEVKMSSMRANERYYRLWAERSEEIFESMMEGFDSQYVHCTNNGAAPYDQLADEYFSESVFPGEGLQISDGDVNTPLIEGFTQWINENGGEVRYNVGGEQLIKDGDKIVGLYAKNSDGSYLKVNAKAVIVSGGGFEGNPEMVAELAPHVIGTNVANTVPGDGSAISMCVWVGAQTQLSPCCIMMSSAKSPQDPNVPNPIPFICVNKNGQRFANEATSSFVIPYAILNQPDRRAWQIFDANYAKVINDLKIQTWMGTIIFDDEKIEKFEAAAVKADTLVDLATQLGVDPDGLQKTVDNYGQMIAAGNDSQFGLPLRFMQAVNPVTPPFYGMEIPYNCLVSLGGIICNPDTSEVLDADKNPIPGLYATGNTVGERFGMAYTNNVTGLSNAFGDIGGFIAGESAGAYIATA
jgi:fumarate reductase flavoprotein subunit